MLGRSPESWWVVPGFANCLALRSPPLAPAPSWRPFRRTSPRDGGPARRPQPSHSSRDRRLYFLLPPGQRGRRTVRLGPLAHRGTPSRLVPAVSVLTAWPLVLTCDTRRTRPSLSVVADIPGWAPGTWSRTPVGQATRVGPAATGGRITAGPRLRCSVGTWKRLLALHPDRDLAGGTTSGIRVLRPPAAVARPEILGHQGLR
jgi:hypothetical protein